VLSHSMEPVWSKNSNGFEMASGSPGKGPNQQRTARAYLPNGGREPHLGYSSDPRQTVRCSAFRSPNELSPAGCRALRETPNQPGGGRPFFAITAMPSPPWTSSPCPLSPSAFCMSFSSWLTIAGESCTATSTRQPTSGWIVQQLREAFPFDSSAKYLLFDRDTRFGFEVLAAVKSLGTKPVRTLSFAKTPQGPESGLRNNVTEHSACYSFQTHFEFWRTTARVSTAEYTKGISKL